MNRDTYNDLILSAIDNRDITTLESALSSRGNSELYDEVFKYLLDNDDEDVIPFVLFVARLDGRYSHFIIESLIDRGHEDLVETLLEDPQVINNLLNDNTMYKLSRDSGAQRMTIIRRTIEESMSISSFIDLVYQLQDLYYLLSNSNVSKKRINREFAESLFEVFTFNYINEIELIELPPISTFEKKRDEPSMDFEIKFYKDLLNLIYWILYKFVGEGDRYITVRYGKLSKQFDVRDSEQLALISPIIVHLQGLNLRDDGVGIPVKPVDVSPLLVSIDRIMNALKYFIKTERDYKNLAIFFRSAEKGFDLLRGLIDDRIIYFSLTDTLLDMDIIKSARDIMDKIILELTAKPDLDVMLERLAVLDYYYRMSSTLAEEEGSLEIEWEDFEDKNPPNPVEFEMRPFNIQEYDFDSPENEFTEIAQYINYVDPSSLRDIQRLTYKILDRHRPDALVDGVYLKRESHPFGIINPLIRYYEQQDYSKRGDRFVVAEIDTDYIELLNRHRDIMEIYELFENEWKDFAERDENVQKFIKNFERYEYNSNRVVPFNLVPTNIDKVYEEAMVLKNKYDRVVRGITKLQRKYTERLYSPTGVMSRRLADESMQELEDFQ